MISRMAGEGFSLLAALFLWISISRPTPKKVLIWQSFECTFRVFGIFFLGNLSGSAMYLTALIRDLIIISENEKLNRYVIQIVVFLQLLFGICTFHVWFDIFSIMATVQYTLFLKTKDPFVIKKVLFVNLIIWEIYAICLGGIVMIFTNTIMVITSLLDLIYIYKK